MLLAAGTVDGVTYTTPLAVFDAVPVVLSLLAYYLLATEVSRRDALDGRLAMLGVGLVGAGGFAKVLWKVEVAVIQVDVVWLDDLLFPFLATGFALLWGALAGQARRGVAAAGVVLALAGALAVTAGNDAAETLLLAAMVIGSLGISIGLIRRAARGRDRRAVIAISVSVATTFLLAGLARAEQTAMLQWIEEASNAVGQGLFLWGVARLVPSRDLSSAESLDSVPLT